jgi:hypothetical protein
MPARVAPECRGVYLLTHPRSASNLFQKMMEKQPGYQNMSYKLFDAGFMAMAQLERGPLDTWPKADRQALYDAFDAGVESLEINRNVSTWVTLLFGRGRFSGEIVTLAMGHRSKGVRCQSYTSRANGIS